MRRRGAALLAGGLLAICASTAAAESGRLTEAAIRAFAIRQEALWSRRDLAGFFALAAPDAVYSSERIGIAGRLVREQHDVTQARRSAERALSKIRRFRETAVIERIDIAVDGRSARVLGREEAEFVRLGVPERDCARTMQTVVLRGRRILSLGQTDRRTICQSRR